MPAVVELRDATSNVVPATQGSQAQPRKQGKQGERVSRARGVRERCQARREKSHQSGTRLCTPQTPPGPGVPPTKTCPSE